MRKLTAILLILASFAAAAGDRDWYAEAEALYYGSRYPEAIKAALEGVASGGMDESGKVDLYSILGSSYARLGAFDKAADYMNRCYEYDKANGEVKGLTSSLINLASMYVYAGEPDLAVNYALAAIENERGVGRPDKLAMAYGKACDVYHALGRDSTALEYANLAVAIADKDLDELPQAVRRSQRAYPLEALERYGEALQDLLFAEKVFRARDNRQSLGIICFQLGQEYGRQGRRDLERQYLREAAGISRELSDLPLLQKVCRRMATSLQTSDPAQAYLYLEEASALQDSIARGKSANTLELYNIEYETARREQTISEQKLELLKERRRRGALIGIVLVLVAFAALITVNALRARRNERMLKASNEQKDFLFRAISHDIHSPAVAQLRGIQMLRGNADRLSGAQVGEVMVQLERQAESEVELIDNVLRWARSNAGQAESESVRFLLNELAEEVISQYGGSASMKGIKLILDTSEAVSVCANRSNLALVLRNLLSNAIKFSHPGSEVRISLCSVPGGAELSVSDHGVGIPVDKIEGIFEAGAAFRRAGTDGEPSNGMGLAVSRKLIEESGGSLKVESVEGKGSRFTIFVKDDTQDE